MDKPIIIVVNNYLLTLKNKNFMAKMNEFRNGAVIKNDNNEFLCTENGRDLFWSNSTEFAFCFENNEAAEKFLNEWNDNHRRQGKLNMILDRVRIESSNCMCGEERTPIGSLDDNEISDEVLALATSILRDENDTLDEIENAVEEKEELQETIKQAKSDLKDVEAEIVRLRNKINRKLDAVFSPSMKEKVLEKLLG